MGYLPGKEAFLPAFAYERPLGVKRWLSAGEMPEEKLKKPAKDRARIKAYKKGGIPGISPAGKPKMPVNPCRGKKA